MSIENRGENKWRFRVRKDGINYSMNFYGSEREAEQEHKKFEVDVMRGKIGYNENMKFSELAQLVLDEYIKPNLKANTEAIYVSLVNNHLLEPFGDMKISSIKPLHIQKIINEKAKTLKPTTISVIYAQANKIFNKAVQWGILSANPCKGIKLPKVKRTNYRELLSNTEINKLIQIINNQPILYKTVYSIALYTGMRQGEILGLSISDIDFEEKTINVNKQYGRVYIDGKLKRHTIDTKTENSVRKIYVPDFLLVILKQYIESMKIRSTEDILFYNQKNNKTYDRDYITEKFRKLLKDNNLPQIRFHDLRHLYATMAINSGINIVAVARTLGDTIETVLKNYTHGIEEEQQKATYNFEKYINKL
jgi:integrase